MSQSNDITTTTPPPLKVLCVDDEQNVLRALKRMLRTEPYTLYQADNAREALTLMDEHRCEIVISDMRMPEMAGDEFLAKVAEQHPDTVRILLTGYSDMESTVRAINQGRIHRYIQKPWNNEELILTIQQAAEHLRLRRENVTLLNQVQTQNQALAELNDQLEDKVRKRTQQIRSTLEKLEQANVRVKENLRSTIRVFYNLISLNPHLGGKQTTQIATLCSLIASKMDLDTKQVRSIHLAGLLYELGLLGMPDVYLKTPYYHLTSEQKEHYRKHPMNAYLALAPAIGLADVALIIKHQYEEYRGTGIPDRLDGDAIPLGSRILAVARDYIHLISGRLQDTRTSSNGALERLTMDTGHIYDNSVVEALSLVIPKLEHDSLSSDEKVVSTVQLEPGVKLSRDVFNKNHILLLPEGHRLTAESLSRLRAFEDTEGQILEVYILEGG